VVSTGFKLFHSNFVKFHGNLKYPISS
jgi:hypothetical protein